jgi:hypothetical protein
MRDDMHHLRHCQYNITVYECKLNARQAAAICIYREAGRQTGWAELDSQGSLTGSSIKVSIRGSCIPAVCSDSDTPQAGSRGVSQRP